MVVSVGCLGFGVEVLGFRLWDVGFGVENVGSRVWGLWLRVEGVPLLSLLPHPLSTAEMISNV